MTVVRKSGDYLTAFWRDLMSGDCLAVAITRFVRIDKQW
jgi:hypothetical protein